MLQQLPIGKKFVLVKLRPRLDEALLALRNKTDDESHRGNGKHRDMIAVVRVKVGDMMTLGRLGEHPYNDAVKAGEFGHVVVFQRKISSLIPRSKHIG